MGSRFPDFLLLIVFFRCVGSESGADGQPGRGEPEAAGPARPGHHIHQGEIISS